MSSGTATPTPQAELQPQPRPDRYETFIEDRLRQTRRQVKGVDIAAGLITLAIGILTYLLAATVIDHWLISGGLGFWGRLLLLAGLLGAGGYYLARCMLPPLLRRINPVFAAHTIEQSRPTLRNSLINFLLLRSHRGEMSPPIYRALEHRAAADLSQVEVEAAVDRTHVMRLGYLLVGVLAVCCLYLVLSPKNPFTSAARVLWPWARIKAPTRVTIKGIKPGDLVAFHGDRVAISAEVDGLNDGEPVLLYYTTAAGQIVNQAIPMTRPEDGYRHQCKLPPGELGLQQDLEYYLAACDCTTRRFAIDVQTAPAILVDRIEYHYPPYTGIAHRIVEGQGDIRAIEGTEVTVRATANQEIGRAEIDLDCDGRRGMKMNTDGSTASGRFTLRLNPEDPTRPEHDSYQLRFTDRNRRTNRRPIRHRIEVVHDLPPEVQLVEPRQEEVQLAVAGRLMIRVRAEDPDFALRRVALRAELRGKSLPIRPLLNKLHQGEFQSSYLFEPARLGLKPGDRVVYWAEAEDNKRPLPGRSETRQQWITIVEPESGQPPEQQPDGVPQDPQQDPQDKQDQQPDQQPDQQSDQAAQPQEDQPQAPGDDQQPGKDGQPQQNGQQAQRPDDSDQQREPIDGETNAGDAFEEILKHRDQQQSDQQEGAEKPDARGGEPQQSQTRPGAGKPSSDDAGAPSPQEANQPRDKKPGDTGQNLGQRQEPAKSPTTSPKDSDSQGDTAGDRSGGGEEGGGQQAQQSGSGTAGTHTEAEQGGAQAQQPGDGQTGTRGGDQVETDRQTGSAARRGDRGEGREPDAQIDSPDRGVPQQRPTDGDEPGERSSEKPGVRGQGRPADGGRPGEQADVAPPPETGEPGGDDPNKKYAEEQTDLALQYLRDQLAKQQPDQDLLDRLGWTPEDLARFTRRWEQMKRAAAQKSARGEAARKRLDDALKSLGLRPWGTELRRGGTRTERLKDVRESRRLEPPPEWQELLRAYSRGVAAGGRE